MPQQSVKVTVTAGPGLLVTTTDDVTYDCLGGYHRGHGVRDAGVTTAPAIKRWLLELNAWWEDDETPWCGVACAAWVRAVNLVPPKAWYRALAWASWGVPLAGPVHGCVVVLERMGGGGHVGFVVGRDRRGWLLVLGGNQGDAVSIAAFNPMRVVTYRWPAGVVPPAGPDRGIWGLALGSAQASPSEA